MSSVSRDNGLWKEVEKRRTRMGLKYAGLGAERHSLLSRTLSVGSFLRCGLLLCLVHKEWHVDGVVAHRDWVLWTATQTIRLRVQERGALGIGDDATWTRVLGTKGDVELTTVCQYQCNGNDDSEV